MSLLESWARGDERGAFGRHSLLLSSIVVLLVSSPFVRFLPQGGARFSIVLYVVLGAAVYANSTQRWVFLVSVATAVSSIVAAVVAVNTGSHTAQLASDSFGLGLFGFTTLSILNSLMHTQRVSRDTVVGGVCVYLLIGLCFALSFVIATDLDPRALLEQGLPLSEANSSGTSVGISVLYFSFVTLTTLGYGDITPHTEVTKMLVSGEAVIGQLFVAIFIARLVAMRRD